MPDTPPVLQELYGQLKAQEDVYSQLLAKGRLMLLNRDDSGSGSKTEQSVALLEQKWCLVSTKMEERKVLLAEGHRAPRAGAAPCCSALPERGWGEGLLSSITSLGFFLDSTEMWLNHTENESKIACGLFGGGVGRSLPQL